MGGGELLLFAVSIASGAVATVTGFGIGSILTPLLALQAGTKVAVALISIPHFLATFLRFWIIRHHVNKKVLVSFGLASAVGGLFGALLQGHLHSPSLTVVFGGLLIFSGFMGMTGLISKMRFYGPTAWIAGVLSGGFGGLVGNQGGIRSVALMGFDLSKETLIATTTAIGVIVDLARMPVYIYSEYSQIISFIHWVLIVTLGVILGTLFGVKFLHRISEALFRKLVGALILILGVYMLRQGLVIH